MRYLLDTNVVIRGLTGGAGLRSSTRALLDETPEIAVSVVNVWEAAVKSGTGKLRVDQDFPALVRGIGASMLEITEDHAWRVRELPLLHKDPFDRLLIAQALVEDLTLVTTDRFLKRYPVRVLEA